MATELEALQKVTDDYAANKAAVAAALGDLNAKIADLKTQIANNPDSTQSLLDLATQIEADTAALQATQQPPVDTPPAE